MTDDYIKREDAFKWVCLRCTHRAECESLADRCYVEQSINKIPAADVEEIEHGDWVEYTNRDGQMASYCSACGSDPGVLYLYRRCPECGAHMSMKLTKEEDDAE